MEQLAGYEGFLTPSQIWEGGSEGISRSQVYSRGRSEFSKEFWIDVGLYNPSNNCFVNK